MKTNPRSTRGFFTLLAYHERSRHSTAFQRCSPRAGTITESKNTWLPRIEIAPLSKPTASLLTQQHRKVAA